MKLEAKGIGKHFGKQRVLEGINLSFGSGEIVGLLGPNGAGKTTALRILAGEIQPDGGEVVLNDRPITSLSASDRARMGIRFLSQETPGFDEQRLALSAFVSEGAKLLIADEIFTGANPKASDLKEFLLNSRNKDVGILVSGFNVRDALDIVDRAYLIYDGRIMQSGSRRDLLGDA